MKWAHRAGKFFATGNDKVYRVSQVERHAWRLEARDDTYGADFMVLGDWTSAKLAKDAAQEVEVTQ